MSITRSPQDTKKSEQVILNNSYDTDFNVLATELLGYDSGGSVLRRLRVDSTGAVVLNTDSLEGLYVNVTGDTMTGALTINTNSTTALKVEQDGVKDNTLVVDTTNGRVGIGAVPTSELDINGSIYLSSALTPSIDCVSSWAIKRYGGLRIGFWSARVSYYDNTSTEVISLVSGNVGVGITSSLSAKLHLVGNQYINTNSATALLVEQDGVKDDVLIVDTTNAKVKFGSSASAQASFDYYASSDATLYSQSSFGWGNQCSMDGTGGGGQNLFIRTGGTIASQTAVLVNMTLGTLSFRGHTGSGISGSKATVFAGATENWSTTANGTRLVFQTTPNTTTTLTTRFLIGNDGIVTVGSVAGTGRFNVIGESDIVQAIIKGNSAQTSNLQEWQNSSGTVLTNVGPTGRVGILTASTTTEGLKVSDTQTVNTGTVNAISGTMTPSPTAATDATYRSGSFITTVGASSDYAFTGSVIGLFGQTQILSTHTTGTISNTYGLSFSASNRSPVTATNVYGCSTIVSNRGSGTTTNAYGLYTYGYTDTNDALNGTMTTFYGLRIAAFSKGANTTLTNQYGISIANVDQGATINTAIVTNAGLVIFNEGGDSSTDVRMEGDANANLFFLDASSDRIGIGNNATPIDLLDINSTTGGTMSLRRVDTSVTANDLIGAIYWYAADTSTTTNFNPASIEVYANSTVTTDINPGYMIFKTTGTGVAGALTEVFRLTATQDIQIAEGNDIILGTTTGSKIGQATNQLLGFYGVTPVDQPATVADASDLATAITSINALIDRLQELGLVA